MAQLESQKGNAQECIQQCLKCYEVCTRTVAIGLEVNEDQDFIISLQLCAQACQLTAQALMLESSLQIRVCVFCAELCKNVADLCQDFDEPEILECGRACRSCAKSCQKMLPYGASRQIFQSDIRLV